MNDDFPLDRIYHKPILKWLGGKSDLLDRILPHIQGSRFIEPFMGSAVVGLNVDHQIPKIMADSNSDLVNLYKQIILAPQAMADRIKVLFEKTNNTEEGFYGFRTEFNRLSADSFERAAVFVYLNRHCFNGVCRYNSSGGFNVPYGKYAVTYAPCDEILRFGERMKNATFICADFEKIFEMVQDGDVVYCDPPYLPLQANGFVNYSGSGFSMEQQKKLADCAREAMKKGASVIISNHDVPIVEELYLDATIKRFNVRRSVNSDGKGRGNAPEILAIFTRVLPPVPDKHS